MSIEPTRENVEKELDERGVLDSDNQIEYVVTEYVDTTGGRVSVLFQEGHHLTNYQTNRLNDFGLEYDHDIASNIPVFQQKEGGELSWNYVEPQPKYDRWVKVSSLSANVYTPVDEPYEVKDGAIFSDYLTMGGGTDAWTTDVGYNTEFDRGWNFSEMEIVDVEDVPDAVKEKFTESNDSDTPL